MSKCLIADDSKVIRMLLSKILGNFGFDIIEAENGEEAIEMFNSHRPGLVIMDWFLPIMDGIDVLYKIRSMPNIAQPKILFCSTYNGIENIKKAIEGGVDDYIIKPFDEEIIYSKLAVLGVV